MILYPGGIHLYDNYHMLDVDMVVWGLEHVISCIHQQYYCFICIFYIMHQMV